MDASEVFNADDFKSVRLSIIFQNLTTRTEVRDRSKVALVEVGDRTILLEIPGKSCQTKHSVLIKIERPKKKAKSFELLSTPRRRSSRSRTPATEATRFFSSSCSSTSRTGSVHGRVFGAPRRHREVSSSGERIGAVDPKSFPGGDAFVEFIQDRKILIADASSVTRASLSRILNELGVKGNQISLVSTMEQALEEDSAFSPARRDRRVDLGKRCGLDLIQIQREKHPEQARECVFIVVAGNTSQSAVARAAEEDVDAYIVKPYTQDTVRKTLMRVAMTKANPSDYVRTIETGKKKLTERSYDEAEGLFNGALKLDPSPPSPVITSGR